MTPMLRRLDRSAAGRLPLRFRLVAGFVLAMLIVLSAAAAFVYWRVRIALDTGLDRSLREQMTELRGLVDPNGNLRDETAATTSTAAQSHVLLSPEGSVLAVGTTKSASSLPAARQQLLTASELRAVESAPITRNLGALLPGAQHPRRILASRQGTNILVVVAARDQRDEALRELLVQLSLGGLGALVVASVVGERLAKAALAPVERYRSQAETIATGAHGVRLDVPDRRNDEVTRLGHTFNRVLTALERALETERGFTHAASHELRTPLTTLSGRLQLTRRRRRTPEEYESALDEMSTDIGDLINLTDQLLSLGIAENPTGRHPQAVAPGDLHQVASRAAAEHGAHLSAEDDPVPVEVSDAELYRIVANLTMNAGVHGDLPVDISLRLGTTDAGQLAILTVHDRGKGIDPNFLPSAFARFQRAEDAQGRPGSGLGLALVAAILEDRGELRLCSQDHHHRHWARYDFPCMHDPAGTTATIALAIAPQPDRNGRRLGSSASEA